MNKSVQTSFSTSSSTTADYLIIEQKDYEESTGKVTMLDIVNAIGSDFLGSYTVDCGMNSDGISFNSTVYVYPYPEFLIYDTGMSHGVRSQSASKVITETQEIHFNLDNTATLKYPALLVLSETWTSDDIFLEDGSSTTAPTVTLSGREVSIDKKVAGTLEIVYRTKRDSFNILISARLTASENVFQAAFYARYDGGIEIMDVEPPDNAEENYANGVNCANATYTGDGSGDTSITPPGDSGPPTVEGENIVISLSLCEDFGHDE